jgi:hypothetical protein
MDEEIFESAALRSLDDFKRLAVANGSPDLAERLERGAPAFFKAVVASYGGRAKCITQMDRAGFSRSTGACDEVSASW